MNLFAKSTFIAVLILFLFLITWMLPTPFVIFIALSMVTLIPIGQTLVVLFDDESIKESS